jgi:pimeloyl-ACP methyl ester carboxylesterase
MLRKWPVLAAVLCCPVLWAQQLSDLSAPSPIPPGSTLVIGFLGGFEHWNDNHRSVRQLTLKLRERPHVYAESFSNWHRTVAVEFIRRALDTNQNGTLDPEERDHARIILFGQSLGGAAALATARDLDQLGVPVLLTVQIDSVGLHDQLIPPNVRAAANFYQHDPLTIQGRTRIQADDPSRTRILANAGSSYIFRSIDRADVSWARRTFGGSHAKMELDPKIWNRVEHLIVDAMSRR